jgi:hypothetical protein
MLLAAPPGCGSSSDPTGVENLRALRGDSIGLVTLEGIPSLELRYVLQEGAGMDSRALGGEVRYVEATADSLPDMLRSGEVEAALLPPQVAFSLLDETEFEVPTRVSAAMAELTRHSVPSTVLLTARDEAVRRGNAFAEARRMILESTSYFRANQGSVLEAVVREYSLDAKYVSWLSNRQQVVLGDSSSRTRRAVSTLWSAAVEMGDLTEAPEMQTSWFGQEGDDVPEATRQTVSLAVLDDGLHRGALYALEQGLVESDAVDVAVTYLSPSGLTQAVHAGEYDVVEYSPLLVATGRRARLDLVVLSGGIEDIDSTLLFDYVSN